MEREYKFLPAVISLTAGLVISIVVLINGNASLKSLILVLSFLLGFYILGLIFRALLIKFKTKKVEPEEAEEENLENIDSEESETTEEE